MTASLATVSTSTTISLSGWTATIPDPAFNPATGIYTVPRTGPYLLTFNSQFGLPGGAAQTIGLGSAVNPVLEIQRISPAPAVLVSGKVGIMNVNVALVLSLRALIQGQVGMSAVQQLSAGDLIQARYNANGLFMNVSLENTTFSVVYLGAP